MNRTWVAICVLALAACGAASAVFSLEVRVITDRVNLRARADMDAEVVAQVSAGDVLSVVGTNADWVEVVAPTNVSFWAYGLFIKDGVVVPDKLNVRSGPGVNYHSAVLLHKGDRVNVRRTVGDWLEIEPPPGATLWVHRSMVAHVGPVPPAPGLQVAVAATGSVQAAVIPAVTNEALAFLPPKKVEPPPQIARRKLAPVLGQGAKVQRGGVIQSVDYLFFRPADFQLTQDASPHAAIVCYIEGNQSQLAALRGRRVQIEGREYWVQKLRHAIIVPEVITPLP